MQNKTKCTFSNPFKDINTFYTYLAIGMCLLVVVTYIISVFKSSIHVDSAYYINTTKLLIDGKQPIRDFALGYTPLTFYLNYYPFKLYGSIYPCIIGMMYLFQFVNGFVIYKICQHYTDKNNLALIFASSYLLISFLLEGRYYLLETYINFFGLLSIYATLCNRKYIMYLAGVLAFMSFWSKQYGLGFLLLDLVLIAANSTNPTKLKDCLRILCGFFVAFVVGSSLLLSKDVGVSDMFVLSGSGYEKQGFIALLKGVGILLSAVPILIVTPYVLYKKRNLFREYPMLICSMLGICGFLLQCYVRPYPHYVILCIPFVVFVLLISYTSFESEIRDKWKYCFILLFVAIPVVICAGKDYAMLTSSARQDQIDDAKSIAQYVPARSNDVFMSKDMFFCEYYNEYYPPMLKRYGMSSGFVENDSAINLIMESSYCIIDKFYDFYWKKDYVQEYLENNFDKTVLPTKSYGDILIFKRKSLCPSSKQQK